MRANFMAAWLRSDLQWLAAIIGDTRFEEKAAEIEEFLCRSAPISEETRQLALALLDADDSWEKTMVGVARREHPLAFPAMDLGVRVTRGEREAARKALDGARGAS